MCQMSFLLDSFGTLLRQLLGTLSCFSGLTPLFQAGNMFVMQKDFTFGFYFYFFGKPLRPQQAEEVCLS